MTGSILATPAANPGCLLDLSQKKPITKAKLVLHAR